MIKNQSRFCEFARPFPMLTDQTALQDLAAHLAGGDLNCLVHRNLGGAREYRPPPLFHLALGFMACGLVVSFFLKEVPLRKTMLTPAAVTADEGADIVGAPEPVSLRVRDEETA